MTRRDYNPETVKADGRPATGKAPFNPSASQPIEHGRKIVHSVPHHHVGNAYGSFRRTGRHSERKRPPAPGPEGGLPKSLQPTQIAGSIGQMRSLTGRSCAA